MSDLLDVIDVIAQRKSVRSYAPEHVEMDVLRSLQSTAEQAKGLTEAKASYFLDEDGSVVEGELTGLLGDYGKVIHAPHYLVIAIGEVPGYLVDAGYRFEQAVIEATRLGLGTCWIGGFFRERRLSPLLHLESDRVGTTHPESSMRVVALTPLGYPTPPRGRRKLVHSLMRAAVKPSRRKPIEELFFWQRYGAPLPRHLREQELFASWLEAIRRAPSWANRQPWRFIVDSQQVLVLKKGSKIKEGKDYHLVDCGIAMSHLHLAASALDIGGGEGRWTLSPEPSVELPAGVEMVARYDFAEQLR